MVSVHQVIQEFIKSRLQSNARETVAREAVLVMLTDCIELEEETFMCAVVHIEPRFLLPHLIRARQESQRMSQRCQVRRRSNERSHLSYSGFGFPTIISQHNIYRLMKFSIKYFSEGEYQQARIFQEEARYLTLKASDTVLNLQCLHVSLILALTYHRLHLFTSLSSSSTRPSKDRGVMWQGTRRHFKYVWRPWSFSSFARRPFRILSAVSRCLVRTQKVARRWIAT